MASAPACRRRRSWRSLHRRGAASTQDKVEHVAEGEPGLRHVDREIRDHALAGAAWRAQIDRIELEQRVTRKIHLRDEAGQECRTKQREMDVVWPPGVVVIAPWVGAGLDRVESIPSLTIGDAAPATQEIRVERCIVLVGLVYIASAGIGLPDLEQSVGQRPPVLTHNAAGDNDALAERLSVLARILRQISIQSTQALVGIDRSGQFRQRLLDRYQRLGRSTQRRGAIGGV